MTRSKLIKLTAPHRHKVGRNTLFLVVDSQACLHEGTHLANLPGNKGDSCCKNESLAVDPFGQPQVQQHEGDAENLDDKDAQECGHGPRSADSPGSFGDEDANCEKADHDPGSQRTRKRVGEISYQP